MANIRARNAAQVAQYITKDNLDATDIKLLRKYKTQLIVSDGMSVDPFREKIEIEYLPQYFNDIPKLADYLANVFINDDVVYDDDLGGKKATITVGKINLKFAPKKEGKRNQTPTDIQEKGTTVIFNRVLKLNKTYPSVEAIKADKILMGELKKTFTKKYENNLDDWLLSYYEQQEKFFLHKKYSPSKWGPFEYNGSSFTKFFKTFIREGLQTIDGSKVKTYEQWNPADIWAAYDMNAMKKEINEAFEIDRKKAKPLPTVSKLNNLLIQYMNDSRLVGISLKKIEKAGSTHLEFFNITPKSMKISQVVNYKMNDLTFDIQNIAEHTKVTTYIRYGSPKTHEMNINLGDKKKFGNLSFNTQIKGSSAQGGQAPVYSVINLLHTQGSEKSFKNDNSDYPHDIVKYGKERTKIEKQYTYLKSHTKISGLISWTDFDNYIKDLYMEDLPQIAVSKLMQINFYYCAFKNYPNDEQFWISLLHLGMKVGKRFAPHAKISD